MFAMVGYIQKYGEGFMAKDVWEAADCMLEARDHKKEVGITAVKRRKKND